MRRLALPDAQRDLLENLKQTGKPVVVLLVTGRPMELAREAELADALLLTWYPGTMAARRWPMSCRETTTLRGVCR